MEKHFAWLAMFCSAGVALFLLYHAVNGATQIGERLAWVLEVMG